MKIRARKTFLLKTPLGEEYKKEIVFNNVYLYQENYIGLLEESLYVQLKDQGVSEQDIKYIKRLLTKDRDLYIIHPEKIEPNTEVLDITGKSIFLGDIVSFFNGTINTHCVEGKVVYNEGAFMVEMTSGLQKLFSEVKDLRVLKS